MRIAGASTERSAALVAGFALLALSLSMPAPARAGSNGQATGASADAGTSTAEIPPAQSLAPPPQTTVEATGDPLDDPSQGAGANIPSAEPGANGELNHDAAASQQIEAYEAAQNPAAMPAPRLHSLQEFMAEGSDTSEIGVELREDRRKLSGGGEADGLLILKVNKDSPAAEAGLHGYSTAAHSALEGVALVAAMVFPPAVLAVAILEGTHMGESYDMIIGVDGKRVTNYLDFEDQIRDAKPGDVVYLSVVRNGKRIQTPVHLPLATTTAKASN